MRALLVIAALFCAAAGPCADCTAAGGTYHTVAPPGWDGKSKLGLLLFLHGWMTEGLDITGDPDIAAAAGKMGFLLVAPDGLMKSWAPTGAPSQARDDIAFLRAVVRDVEARWPIDRGRVVAAGFSLGASMVWDLACYDAGDFTAFLPFSGGFWRPLPKACRSGPVDLRHVHGTDDHTMPMAGRHLFGPFWQGDIRAGFRDWVAEDRCRGKPVALKDWAGLTCETWTGCAGGRRLQLCVRAGGHQMWQGDVLAGLRWAVAR
jgi:polyhydroxybutyrate depolymerase